MKLELGVAVRRKLIYRKVWFHFLGTICRYLTPEQAWSRNRLRNRRGEKEMLGHQSLEQDGVRNRKGKRKCSGIGIGIGTGTGTGTRTRC